MPNTASDYRRYLDAKTLARIEPLELRARLVVEGFYSGMHRSPYQGLSVEFAEHRQFTQGDDLRHIDWKVYGRTDKRYVKRYVEETNLVCMLVVDASESMSYRSHAAELSKFEYATSAAAALAYLAIQQHDSVGLVSFDEKIGRYVKPANHSSHWKTLVNELERPTGGVKTSVRAVLDDLAERLKRRTLVVLISDLFDDVESIIKGLQRLQYRRHDIIVLHVLDPAELTFDFRGPTRFDGLEGMGRLDVDPAAIRKPYLEEVDRFLTTLRAQCRRLHIDCETLNTGERLDLALSAYLANRAARVG